MCQWVEEVEGQEGSGLLWFRNRNGLGLKPRVFASPNVEAEMPKPEVI